jgi:predicted nuclease of predicted toxin-antitoxin system
LRLLFDENLSPRLVGLLRDVFPESRHVHDLGLGSADDESVLVAAVKGGFAIVTKDSDFHDRALLSGTGTKIVWIRRRNCATAEVEALLRANLAPMLDFARDAGASVLVLY